MDIKIVVATHKPYRMPEDPIYLPLHVGHAGKKDIGYAGDDTGDNISWKNSNYNELTGIYWAWKNLDADYIGMVHYRRYYAKSKKVKSGDPYDMIASREDIEQALRGCDVVLPKKRFYYIETVYSHYIHLPFVIPQDLECLKSTIQELTPEYSDALEQMLKRRWAHMFNMFIMKRELFDRYCEWLFQIMDAVDKKIDMSGRKPIEARYYISEFLMDTWIEKNRVPYKEMDVVFIEKEENNKKYWRALKRALGINIIEKRSFGRS